MVVTAVNETPLTHENIPAFVNILRRFLAGRTFTVSQRKAGDEDAIHYENARLVNISVVTLETGPMRVEVVTDKVTLIFTSYDPNEFSGAIGVDEGLNWIVFGQIQDTWTQTFWTEIRRREGEELVSDHVFFIAPQSHMPGIV